MDNFSTTFFVALSCIFVIVDVSTSRSSINKFIFILVLNFLLKYVICNFMVMGMMFSFVI